MQRSLLSIRTSPREEEIHGRAIVTQHGELDCVLSRLGWSELHMQVQRLSRLQRKADWAQAEAAKLELDVIVHLQTECSAGFSQCLRVTSHHSSLRCSWNVDTKVSSPEGILTAISTHALRRKQFIPASFPDIMSNRGKETHHCQQKPDIGLGSWWCSRLTCSRG